MDSLPVDANSAAYISSLNATHSVITPDFNSTNGYAMVVNTVPGTQPKVPITFNVAPRSSDPGPYPIPSNMVIQPQPNGDHHGILIDTTNCVLYETWEMGGSASAGWTAGTGAVFPLTSNTLRPAGWTSGDAAGLPIYPGMVRADEVVAGHINHALRITADHTRAAYIWPARHYASSLTGSNYAPMGQRFRLKASFNISTFPAQAQVILQAMKTYGVILADNGESWDLTGTDDSRWDMKSLAALETVSGNSFEAVDESSLMTDPNSGATTQSTSTIPTGWVQITSKKSGLCLDVTGGAAATNPGTLMEQWTCATAGSTNQNFKFTAVSGGYTITARNSSLLLQPVTTLSASKIEQWGASGQSAQVYKITATADGAFVIQPAQTPSYCLDVNGGSTTNGAAIIQYACGSTGTNTFQTNQEWSFTTVN